MAAAQGFTVYAQDVVDGSVPALPAMPEEDVLADDEPLAKEEIVIPLTPPVSPAPNPYDDIPDAYIAEAVAFVQDCENNSRTSLYYDCRCMGAEYLDRRIALGPDAPASQVQLRINSVCADGTGIAGDMYESCTADYLTLPQGFKAEEFCACYANTYAKFFEGLQGPLHTETHIDLMTRARLTCRDPGLAQRFFGR